MAIDVSLIPPSQPVRRICLLLEADRKLMRWAIVGLERAIKECGVSVPLVIVQQPDSWNIQLPVTKKIVTWLILHWRMWWKTSTPWIERLPIDNLPWLAQSKIVEYPAVRAGKYGTALPPEAIQLINNEGIDLVYRRGFGILKGDILTCTPWGVLSYHAGDITRYRGGNSMIETYCNDEEYLVISVQKLNEHLDRGDLFDQIPVPIRSAKSYREVIERFYTALAGSLSQSLKKMSQPGYVITRPVFERQIIHLPTVGSLPYLMLRYLRAQLRQRARAWQIKTNK